MRVLSVGLVAILASLPSVARANEAGLARVAATGLAVAPVAVVQDTVRRDTTTRKAPGDTIRPRGDTLRRPTPGDTTRARTDTAGNLAGSLPPAFDKLDLRLNSRLEVKGEQVKNDRCGVTQLFATAFRCKAGAKMRPAKQCVVW